MIFIHIPKTGGTSIEKMFGQLNRKKLIFQKSQKEIQFHKLGAQKHYCARSAEENYGSFIDQYFKWTIIRNSWEREYSFFNMNNQQRETKRTFLEYLHHINKNKQGIFRDQIDFIKNKKNEIITDEIIRYENLTQGWKNICKIIHRKYEPMDHVNKGEYEQEMSEAYNQECIDLVGEIRAQDIKYFNYDLPKI